ncbi:MAG: hypothetical protein LUE22_00450, partial [Oscillospiraceae bacterium]|nr:hypothetical protein [Oscillospiraceae bacterium]
IEAFRGCVQLALAIFGFFLIEKAAHADSGTFATARAHGTPFQLVNTISQLAGSFNQNLRRKKSFFHRSGTE